MSADGGVKSSEPEVATSRSPETARSAPAESPAEIWTRRAILLAFWAVIVTLGLPHWIWTTSIVRSGLPVGLMNSWAEGQVIAVSNSLHG